jgi:nucleoside-diphosphate-sugar epimerase
MKIFVAGGTGVIGSRVVPRLVEAGHEVMPASRSTVDLFDRDAVTRAVAGYDVIINLATHVPPSSRALLPGAWRTTNRIREQVPRNLVEAARQIGVRRIVQESFAPVYPDRGGDWIDESVPIKPARYNRSVRDAEAAMASFGEAVVLRFAYFYGQDSDFTQDMIRYTRKGWAATTGKPEAFISSVSHADAAAAVVAAMAIPPGTYNVCDDEPVTHREFYRSLAEALHVPPPRFPPAWTKWLLGSVGETLARSQRISNARLRATGAWAPRYRSVREGWAAVVSS